MSAAFAFAILFAFALIPSLAAAAPPPEGELTITPAALAFGATTTGGNSAEQQVDVHNESAASVTIFSTGLQGIDPAEFGIQNSTCAGTLASGQSCTIGVLFSPSGEGPKKAVLRIQSSDLAGEQDIELSGSGVAPSLAFEPGSYDFGLQPTRGEGDAQTSFQLRNTGVAAIHLDFIGFEGPGSNAFSTGNTNCFDATLQPNEACSLQIQFHPQETISYAAQLRVSANGANFTAALSGEGGRAIVAATPSPVEFGPVSLGSTGLIRTITLSNSGDLPQNYFIAFLTGGDVDSFRLLSENCTTAPINPGSSCSAQVRFQPASLGPKGAKISFIGEGEGALQVELKGTAVANSLGLSGDLSFAPQAISSSSQSQTATLTNGGSAAVAVDAISVAGADSDQFRLSDSCSGLVLAPGASCEAAVRFAPDSEGAKSATLRVLAGGERLSASLSGTAVAPARVRLRLRSRPLRIAGAALNVGELSCDSLQSCAVTARAQITARVETGGRSRVRTVTLPTLRLSMPAGQGARAMRLRLTPPARRLLAGPSDTARLRLRFSWASESQNESRMLNLRVK